MTERQSSFDPRITAARHDLAAEALRGHVAAERFVEGERFTVLAETVDLRRRPRPDAPLETQLLYGESVVVYEDDDGWGWAQAERDGYVGYLAMAALGRHVEPATHRVVVNRTFVYPAADMKQPPYAVVPLDGRVTSEGTRGDFLKIRGHGFVFASHLRPVDQTEADFVAVAERLVGVPYLWGGKSALGIDCSGLVQLACSVCGQAMPRDTDMQQKLGSEIAGGDSNTDLRRGDLIFWPGHVGIMLDATMLLHANAHHMLVIREPLAVARDRIAAANATTVASVRRFP